MLLLNYDDNWEQSEQTAEEATHSTSTVDSTKLLRPENQFSKKSQTQSSRPIMWLYDIRAFDNGAYYVYY